MKFSNTDFRLIRWNVTVLAISVVLSIFIFYLSDQFAEHAQNESRLAQKQINDARNSLSTALQDKETLAAYFSDYTILEEDKIIGDDHRLDWMEGLDKLRQQNIVIDFNYSISPQISYIPQPAIDSGSYEIHYSEMRLQFDLLHEGQLLRFLNELQKQVKGHFQLENCAMHRADTNVDNSEEDVNHTLESRVNLKGECKGGWITLKNRNSQP